MTWTVKTLNTKVDEELTALPEDMRARFSRIAFLIEEMGLERIREPHVKHLNGPLWEIRMTGRTGIGRALYVVAGGKSVVVVRVFVKKTRKTPHHAIGLALARAKEVLQ
uniref:Phage-related protein n=1 Tax=Candidatus Kentrum sp. LPFa TaxID=2126335 RepID=A0A450X9I5_9GAMM|nr:MAG: Phage-related protein [Candidatus Kentron sp. LPFa]